MTGFPSRRAVLAGIGAASAIGLTDRRINAQPAQRIVVIGAGLAGLSAAVALQSAGQRVTIVDARARIGGRIHTSRIWRDLPMDLGASLIHGQRGNPITSLAVAAGAPVVATHQDDGLLLGLNGTPVNPDLRAAEQILARALAATERLDDDVSVAQALGASAEWQNAPAELQRLVEYLVNSTLEQEYGSPARLLSAWYGQDADEFGGDDVLFPQGFDQVITHLAADTEIHLSAEVTEIAPGFVRFSDGRRMDADKIICTLPLGVLQSGRVRFARALAPDRQMAIDTLRMGLLNKCWLRFDRVAWPDTADWIGWLGPRPGYWGEWVSLARATGAPVLLGFNAADAAAEIETLDDQDTLAAAQEALRGMFGSHFPRPVAAQITRWGQDRYALGSYSFNTVGTHAGTRRALAGSDWDGQIWFAGEATSATYFGTAHGAALSGRAVAQDVLNQG